MNYDVSKVKITPEFIKEINEITKKAATKNHLPKELPDWAKNKLKYVDSNTDEFVKILKKPTEAFKTLAPTKFVKPPTTGQKVKCYLGKIAKMLIRK